METQAKKFRLSVFSYSDKINLQKRIHF